MGLMKGILGIEIMAHLPSPKRGAAQGAYEDYRLKALGGFW